jgi:hypothetical protein
MLTNKEIVLTFCSTSKLAAARSVVWDEEGRNVSERALTSAGIESNSTVKLFSCLHNTSHKTRPLYVHCHCVGKMTNHSILQKLHIYNTIVYNVSYWLTQKKKKEKKKKENYLFWTKCSLFSAFSLRLKFAQQFIPAVTLLFHPVGNKQNKMSKEPTFLYYIQRYLSIPAQSI